MTSQEPIPNSHKIIDGKAVAEQIQLELTNQTRQIYQQCHGLTPGLAVILVGSRKDSQTYVRMKKRSCAQVGIASFGVELPDDVVEEEVLHHIQTFNDDPKVHGILVQLPLPKHLDETKILKAIRPEKDVDGLHPLNVASLCSMNTHQRNMLPQQGNGEDMNGRRDPLTWNWSDFNSIPFPLPCTPQGCIELLDRYGVDMRGKNAVVIGRSNLVGLPVAMLLMQRDATVTIVHSKTVNAANIVKQADIVIVAAGRARMITKEWIREGAVVIDVGINTIEDVDDPRGYKLVGDVDFDDVVSVAGLITPVPGGVGPMTIAMLLRNTVNSCIRYSDR